MQRSMRPLPVVVLRVLGKDVAQVSLAEDQHPVGELCPHCQTKRSAKQFARGQRGGILTTSMPASARIASNDAGN